MLHGYRQFYSGVKTEDVNKDIVNDVEKIFETSNCGVEVTFPIEKN